MDWILWFWGVLHGIIIGIFLAGYIFNIKKQKEKDKKLKISIKELEKKIKDMKTRK